MGTCHCNNCSWLTTGALHLVRASSDPTPYRSSPGLTTSQGHATFRCNTTIGPEGFHNILCNAALYTRFSICTGEHVHLHTKLYINVRTCNISMCKCIWHVK